MQDPNARTLHAYAQHVEDYLKHTPAGYTDKHEPLLRWLDSIAEHSPQNAHAFEVGSATGREAHYLRSKGLRVQCSDAIQGFVDHLRQIGEQDAILFNLLEDKLPPNGYDVVVANAVLPHFTRDGVSTALKTAYDGIKPGGVFAFSVKQGDGDMWVEEKFGQKRYIHYWQPDHLYDFAISHDYEVLFLENGTVGDIPTHIWINVILRKPKKTLLTKITRLTAKKKTWG